MIPLLFFNSSRILSYIRTLASTDIPIVNTIPAIPGSVKTAPREDKTPKMKKISMDQIPKQRIINIKFFRFSRRYD